MKRLLDTKKSEALFQGCEDTLIWSCLQNVMGEIYVDDVEHPKSAMALLGDFAFFAGEPNEALVKFKPESYKKEDILMVPQNENWEQVIESCYKENADKVNRYAIKKEPDVFDTEKLQQVVSTLPEEYEIKLMDEELYRRSKDILWCCDWVSQYPTYEMYQKLGLGVVILKDDEIVSGASSYSSYKGGIEIEIDTKEEYRRKGLAYVCGAKLILECLKRNLYPSWDAQNLWSVALSEKLGYHFSHPYTTYEVKRYI